MCGVVGPIIRNVVEVNVAPGFVAAAKLMLGVITTTLFICTKICGDNRLTCIN